MYKTKQNYKEKFKNFYNSAEWRRLRDIKFANAGGLCEKCKKIVGGKDVHHIESIEKNWDRRLDYDNLMLLCKDCHNESHGRESELQKFLKMWDNL